MRITAKSFTTLAIAGMIAGSPLLIPSNVSAAETTPDKDAVAQVTTEAKDQEILKTVDEAFKALREVRAARLAIFNGETDMAVEFADAAKQDLVNAENAITTHRVSTKMETQLDEGYVPFDMTISLSEGFVPSKEKKEHLDKANGFLGHGKHKKAVEVLRLANIDVTIRAGLIPIKASLSHVKDALKLLSEKKYYQANLALKALEDSVLIESYSVHEVPEQGANSQS